MKIKIIRIIFKLTKYTAIVLSLLVITMSSISTEKGSAQVKSVKEVKVSINLKNSTLKKVFTSIENQTEFSFTYSNQHVDINGPRVDLDLNETTVEKVLIEVARQTGLRFRQINQSISAIKDKNYSPKIPVVEILNDIDISGRVTDETGQELPGATIVIDGSTQGTITDVDGNYKLTAPEDAVLNISFVGFKSQQIEVNGRSIIDIILVEDLETLSAIVVVGYGTKERKDVTGAISSVKGDDFKNLPISGIDRALQGRMAGVQVVRNGGAPGASTAIRIRGTGTVNNSEPLYIIDGVPTQNINGINQNDIESIDVLKDASASAIYGTRAANGVVIITTRKGKSGKLNLNIDMYAGVSKVVNTLDVLDAPTLAEIKRERYTNDGIPVNPIWQDPQYQTQLTNWQDELFKTGKTQNVDVSISGGNESSTYLFALGYYNEQGVIDKSEADRFSLRINSDHKVTNWLKVGQNMSLSTRTSNGFNTLSAQNGLIWSAIRFHPGLPIKDADGNFSSNQISGEFGDINNPLYEVDINDADRRNTRLLGNVTTEITLTDELSIRANFGVDAEIFDSRSFQPLILNQIRQRTTNSANRSYQEDFSFLMEYFLVYDKLFGDHKVGFVGGYTQQSFNIQGFDATANNLPDEDAIQRFLSNGTANSTTEFRENDGLRSVFGRVNYAYRDRYLLTATVRSDESSKFADGNRRGVFPAFSLGWRLSDEPFFDVSFIDHLKITGGWGELGNQNIARLQYLARISRGARYSFGLDGSNQVVGAFQTSFANEDISWETVSMTNIGMNIGVLNDRLTSTLNYFIKDTDDMLLSPPTIGAQGNNPSPFQNIGKVRNKGFEIELNWRNSKNEFSYSIGANAAFIDNEVVELVDGSFLASRLYGRPNQEISRTFEGSPIATFYGWRADGLFQTQADIDSHALQEGALPGDVRFKDINNDNVIDDKDRVILGSPHPKVTYGINANFGYKGFDATLFFLGVGGVEIYNADRMQGIDASYPFNLYSDIQGRWTGPNTSNSIPRVSTLRTNLNHRTSDLFLESGDFFRLKNLTVGYSLPTSTVEKIGLSRLRFYITGQNVFTITDYSGLDPELGLTDDNLQQNVDFGQFPQARTFLLGVNIGF